LWCCDWRGRPPVERDGDKALRRSPPAKKSGRDRNWDGLQESRAARNRISNDFTLLGRRMRTRAGGPTQALTRWTANMKGHPLFGDIQRAFKRKLGFQKPGARSTENNTKPDGRWAAVAGLSGHQRTCLLTEQSWGSPQRARDDLKKIDLRIRRFGFFSRRSVGDLRRHCGRYSELPGAGRKVPVFVFLGEKGREVHGQETISFASAHASTGGRGKLGK